MLGEESDDISLADIAAEVATYLREKPTKANTSLLIWWQGNEDRFPNVAALAKKYLGSSVDFDSSRMCVLVMRVNRDQALGSIDTFNYRRSGFFE